MGKRNRSNISSVAHFLKEIVPHSEPEERSSNSKVVLTQPSKKKRKIDLGSLSVNFDTSKLAPQYRSLADVPEHLQKYYAQRHRYFSLYDHGCLLDEEGWYSVTPEKIAEQIAERCRCDTILDAFCGVGGNAIAFAKTCHRVIAIDNSPLRLALARHNAAVYDVQDRIEFVLADFLDFARAYIRRPSTKRNIDVVFLSPPWGGPAYLTSSPQKEIGEADTFNDSYTLRSLLPLPGDELFHLSRCVSRNVAFYLPRNVDLEEVSNLVKHPHTAETGPDLVSTQRTVDEYVEVEEEYMGGKLKAVTCYFGGLVSGQEDRF
ncbi:TGS1 [Sanghuangporus vaninii]